MVFSFLSDSDFSRNDRSSWTLKTITQPRSSAPNQLAPCFRLFTATSACASIPGGLDKASLASPGFDLRRLRRWGIPARSSRHIPGLETSGREVFTANRTTVNVIPTDDLAVDYLAEQVSRLLLSFGIVYAEPAHCSLHLLLQF